MTLLNTKKSQEKLFDRVAGVSTALREARITLCSVDPEGIEPGQFYYRSFLKGVASAKQADYGDLLLQVLATQTGGQVLFGSYDIASLILCVVIQSSTSPSSKRISRD